MQRQCIERVEAHLGRKLTEADIKRIDADFLGEQQRMRREDPNKWASMTTAERVTESAKRVMATKARESRQKRLGELSNELALVNQIKTLEEHAKNYTGPGRFGQGAHDLFEGIATQVRGAENAASQGMDAILTTAYKIAKAAGKLKGDTNLWLMFGDRKSDSIFEDVVRSVAGANVDNAAAKAYGDAWSAAKEEHRQLMNRNGGNIGYLDHFMEAMHNSRVMQKIGREAWISFYLKNGDWKKMQHPSGEDWGNVKAGTSAEMAKREFLDESFTSLTTGGINKTILEEVGTQTSRIKNESEKVKVAKASAKGIGANLTKSPGHRILHLKDAQAIIDYNRQFSDRSLGQVFADSLVRTASDAHLVAVAGANPAHTLSQVLETAKKNDQEEISSSGRTDGNYEIDEAGWAKGAGRTVAIDKFGLLARTPDHAFNTLFAPSDAPGKIDRLFKIYSTIKAANALLFTPVRAVFQDTEQIREHAVHTGAYSGLIQASASLKEAARSIKDPAVREELNRFGIALGAAIEKSREYGARLSVENDLRFKDRAKIGIENAANRAAQAQQKFSLLKYETDINRTAGEHINALALGNFIQKEWADLNPSDRSMLSRAGIQESKWHLYQQMPVAELPGANGARAVDTSRIMDHAAFSNLSKDERFALANTVTGFIRAGGDVTTSEFNFQAKMMTGAFGRTGTAKQLMLFKNSPVTQTVNLARRLEHMNAGQRAMFMAGVSGRGLVLGYMAISTVALLNGQQVPDPKDPKTILKSLLVSGGLSMVADMVNGYVNPDEAGHSTSLIPMLSDVQTLGGVVGSTVAGDYNKAGYNLLKFGKSQIPQLNYWYTKAAVNRMFIDDWAESMNPGYKRRLNGYAESSGTPYFWRPGESSPDLGRALEVGRRKE